MRLPAKTRQPIKARKSYKSTRTRNRDTSQKLSHCIHYNRSRSEGAALRHLSHLCCLVAIDISFWSTWQKSVLTESLVNELKQGEGGVKGGESSGVST
ncbi:hypothetical protein BDQ94DRAFT_150492 [Aspergillus welwitschiae]|uniref:Uncharacterized protein n=1 Tax=Aspergillus welwitschiae TaxID=1341132 RepID=A0A3F3PRI3_9EURO|nr:hypothetical protein BDQ94DRAFT_150492 [Aspergillus welwitschiae]RDH29560.1 hypothetical protein BDQ94DRAFT_150492 [Aspergillus welwitschiae]